MEQNIRQSECGTYIISDIHLGHKNILNHQPNRLPYVKAYAEEHNIEDLNVAHDEWMIDLLLKITKRNDNVYVLGDFIMSNQQEALKILNRLKSNGCKYHLIVGNHDKSIQKMFNMFESIDLIKVVTFKPTAFPFIKEDEMFQCVMCHYPLATWFNKCRGSICLSGHIHDNSPWIDNGVNPLDLAFNVGFDAPLASMGLIPLEEIYDAFQKKLGGIPAKDYADWATEKDNKFIR